MDANRYQDLAQKTSAEQPDITVLKRSQMKALHAALGLCTEAGEIQDTIKRHLFYGKTLDVDNLVEEAGDVLWYVAELCAACGVSMSQVMLENVAKLSRRYPEGFTHTAAIERQDKAEENK